MEAEFLVIAENVSPQEIFDECISISLKKGRHYKSLTNYLFKVSNKDLTDGLFNNSHESFSFFGNILPVKKIQEIFIASIFSKILLNKYSTVSKMNILIPIGRENGTDIVIDILGDRFLLQIKEYFNFKNYNSPMLIEQKLDQTFMANKVSSGYADYSDQIILIYLRECLRFSISDFKDIFLQHSNLRIISSPTEASYFDNDGICKKLEFQDGNYNFLILQSLTDFVHVFFKKIRVI